MLPSVNEYRRNGNLHTLNTQEQYFLQPTSKLREFGDHVVSSEMVKPPQERSTSRLKIPHQVSQRGDLRQVLAQAGGRETLTYLQKHPQDVPDYPASFSIQISARLQFTLITKIRGITISPLQRFDLMESIMPIPPLLIALLVNR